MPLPKPDIEKARAGKEAMARRCEAAAAAETPDWVNVDTKRRSLSGRAYRIGKGKDAAYLVEVPPPTTRRRLQVYLHEIAHIVLGHCDGDSRRSYVMEAEAEAWSFEAMKRQGVPVPRKSRQRAAAYVARRKTHGDRIIAARKRREERLQES